MRAEPRRGVFVGLATVDIIYRLRGVPRADSKNIVEEQLVLAGGPATNAAVAFAALGGETRLFTTLGSHPTAQVIRDDLDAQGVGWTDLIPGHRGLPSIASILVSSPGGDRLAAATAARTLPEPPLEEIRVDGSDGALLVDGHLMEASLRAVELARRAGVASVVDGGSWKPRFDELLRAVDIAICAEDFTPPGGGSSRDTLGYLRELGARRAAVTRGERPILYIEDGEARELAVPRVEAVDTLGAGDIFHGAFCFDWARGADDFPASLAFAARVAALSTTSFGTRSWIADLPQRLETARGGATSKNPVGERAGDDPNK